jgi:hypothetical protein
LVFDSLRFAVQTMCSFTRGVRILSSRLGLNDQFLTYEPLNAEPKNLYPRIIF